MKERMMCNKIPFLFILIITGCLMCLDPNEMTAEPIGEKRSEILKPLLLEIKSKDSQTDRLTPKIYQSQYGSLTQIKDTRQKSKNSSGDIANLSEVFSICSGARNKRIKRQSSDFKLFLDVMYIREIDGDMLSCSPVTKRLSNDIVGVVIYIIKTLIITHLHLVFMNDPDLCLLRTLWDEGIVLEVFDSHSWWIRISDINYLSHTQHVLVGPLEWIVLTMEKVKLLYNNSSINALNTRWIWVPSSLDSSDSVSSVTRHGGTLFGDVLQELTRSLQEGVRGVVIFGEKTNLTLSSYEALNSSLTKSEVKIGSILASGDGTWILKVASRWSDGSLDIFRPLWPRPSFDLQNRTIRITCSQKPNVFEYKEGRGLDDTVGYASDLMLIARRHLNFTDVLVPSAGFGSKDANGNWNGMVGVLHRKEAEIAALDFTPNYARSRVIEFGTPFGEDILLILSKAPAEIIKPFLLFQIFTVEVWICIICSALALGVALEIFVRIESSFNHSSCSKTWSFQQIGNSLKIFLYQGSRHWPKENGGRLAAICGISMALIIDALYTGCITAFFAIPFRSTPIDSVEDLLRSNVRLAIRSKTSTYSTMVLNKDGIFYPSRDRVSLFSGSEISTWDFFRIVADGSHALVDVQSSAVGRANAFEKREERCKFYIGKKPVRTNSDVFAYMKNCPVFYQFEKTMQWLQYFGIIEHIKKKYYSAVCETRISSEEFRPMSVTQVQGSFYVLGIGLVLGFFIFLVELICSDTIK